MFPRYFKVSMVKPAPNQEWANATVLDKEEIEDRSAEFITNVAESVVFVLVAYKALDTVSKIVIHKATQ